MSGGATVAEACSGNWATGCGALSVHHDEDDDVLNSTDCVPALRAAAYAFDERDA
jgi:hypothetical protein